MRASWRPKIVKMKHNDSLEDGYQNPIDNSHMPEFEKQQGDATEEYQQDIAPIMNELLASGYDVRSLDDIARSKAFEGAIPMLAKWLPRITNPLVKVSIVRALSVPWAKADAATALVKEFRRTPNDASAGLKWAIGNALEVIACNQISNDLIELVQDKRHGTARQMLAIALGKTKNIQAASILIKLLDDDEVAGHAVIGLRTLNAKNALPFIKRLLNHPKRWVRREVIQAINKIEK